MLISRNGNFVIANRRTVAVRGCRLARRLRREDGVDVSFWVGRVGISGGRCVRRGVRTVKQIHPSNVGHAPPSFATYSQLTPWQRHYMPLVCCSPVEEESADDHPHNTYIHDPCLVLLIFSPRRRPISSPIDAATRD